MPETHSLRTRLFGFTLIPAIAAVSPLMVLPAVSRSAGDDGWASAIAGESVGTFVAIAVAYGWTTVGPALIASATDSAKRGRLYRDAVVARLIMSAVALPLLVVLCSLVAAPGQALLASLMGLQGALIGLSFTWFAVGVGDPRSILLFDAVPRLAVAVLAMLAIVNGVAVEIYPLAGILVTLIGTTVYTLKLLRRYPSAWPAIGELPTLFRLGAPVALNDAALGAYSSVPMPLANLISSGATAAGFASADKLAKLGQFLPLTLANALQAWTAEVRERERARRLRIALVMHGTFGAIGMLVLGLAGPTVTALLFGPHAAASIEVCFALGAAFAMYSLRTSMTRHVLFPAAGQKTVMWATLTATAAGVPAMLVGAWVFGPLGVAVGYALTEAISTTLLARPARRAFHRLVSEIAP